MLNFGKPEYTITTNSYGHTYKHMTAESKQKWYAKIVDHTIEVRTSCMRVNTLVVVDILGNIRLSANGTMRPTKKQIVELATVIQEAIDILEST